MAAACSPSRPLPFRGSSSFIEPSSLSVPEYMATTFASPVKNRKRVVQRLPKKKMQHKLCVFSHLFRIGHIVSAQASACSLFECQCANDLYPIINIVNRSSNIRMVNVTDEGGVFTSVELSGSYIELIDYINAISL